MEQMGIFNASSIQNYVEYKWDTYAKYHHYFGFFIHCIYMLSLSLYILSTYMDRDRYGNVEGYGYPLAMAVCIIYPYGYDTLQLFYKKHEYFYDPWNWSDFFYMYAGITNLVLIFTSYF